MAGIESLIVLFFEPFQAGAGDGGRECKDGSAAINSAGIGNFKDILADKRSLVDKNECTVGRSFGACQVFIRDQINLASVYQGEDMVLFIVSRNEFPPFTFHFANNITFHCLEIVAEYKAAFFFRTQARGKQKGDTSQEKGLAPSVCRNRVDVSSLTKTFKNRLLTTVRLPLDIAY